MVDASDGHPWLWLAGMNFDNMGRALVAIFITISQDGQVAMLQNAPWHSAHINLKTARRLELKADIMIAPLWLGAQMEVMNRSIQSEPEYRMLGVLFFLLLTFTCRLILFNLYALAP